MQTEHTNNPKSPKYYIKKYIDENKSALSGLTIIDIPAGTGITTKLLLDIQAKPEPFDLFPEYFKQENISCQKADLTDLLPITAEYADMIICQEGIEHISDQAKLLKEFNRILKPGGKLLITTPSYSNLSSRYGYMMFESEKLYKHMPANEADSIWMNSNKTNDIYFGHIFLTGIFKLRLLSRLAGFQLIENRYTRLSKASLFLLPIFYLPILISSWMTYRKALSKTNGKHKNLYKELFQTNKSLKNLLNRHLFLVFEKSNANDVMLPDTSTSTRDFENIT
jgi:SAM-dependent methyltransferase